jgi:hypothetical protein
VAAVQAHSQGVAEDRHFGGALRARHQQPHLRAEHVHKPAEAAAEAAAGRWLGQCRTSQQPAAAARHPCHHPARPSTPPAPPLPPAHLPPSSVVQTSAASATPSTPPLPTQHTTPASAPAAVQGGEDLGEVQVHVARLAKELGHSDALQPVAQQPPRDAHLGERQARARGQQGAGAEEEGGVPEGWAGRWQRCRERQAGRKGQARRAPPPRTCRRGWAACRAARRAAARWPRQRRPCGGCSAAAVSSRTGRRVHQHCSGGGSSRRLKPATSQPRQAQPCQAQPAVPSPASLARQPALRRERTCSSAPARRAAS